MITHPLFELQMLANGVEVRDYMHEAKPFLTFPCSVATPQVIPS